MGIKNIHITLISVSVLLGFGFGFWALKNSYAGLGYISLIAAVALIVYGINFIKKSGSL